MSTRRWTDEDLREAVATSTDFQEVFERLGFHGRVYNRVRLRAKQLGLDISHFRCRQRRWTDDQLRAAVAACISYARVIAQLGLVPAGGNYRQVQRRILELDLDTSHFTHEPSHKGTGRALCPPVPLMEVLVDGRWANSHKLKKRLIRAGLKQARCELCGWSKQSPDGRVPVELDHINGDHADNRLVNLRILCPNCHSLQPTHRGSNQKRRRRVGGATG